jgi:hypothetical protein
MRKSLIVYALLLPFLLASSLRIAAALSDAGSSSPWNNPVATSSEMVDDEYGLDSDNLITIAPFFDSVTIYVMPILKLAHGSLPRAQRYEPSSLVTLNRTFRI